MPIADPLSFARQVDGDIVQQAGHLLAIEFPLDDRMSPGVAGGWRGINDSRAGHTLGRHVDVSDNDLAQARSGPFQDLVEGGGCVRQVPDEFLPHSGRRCLLPTARAPAHPQGCG